jgi:predicted small lipoprotein YifL
MRKLLTAVALCALATLAHAGDRKGMYLPPAKYDHPYDGILRHQVLNSQADMRLFCKLPNHFQPLIACAIRYNGSCVVYLAPLDEIFEHGIPLEIILRHEYGHCNGWNGHDGALLWLDNR